MATPTRYPIRFGALRVLMAAMGLWPSNSYLDVDAQQIKAKMGWTFRATFPRSSVRSVVARTGIPGGIGVHGFGADGS